MSSNVPMLAIRMPTYYVTADDVIDILNEALPPFKRTAQETPNVWDDQAVALLERMLANPTTRALLGRVLGRDADLPDDVIAASSVDDMAELRQALIDGERVPSGALASVADTAGFDIGTVITLLPQAIAIAQALIALWQSRNPRGGNGGRGGRRRNPDATGR